ncbi:HET-domain containing protein [Fusarium agapanthi]|uniref:HET-domain containing protein n=1 Tax=Fusarium agapanthi TaxID=1803897 RepID=A0A9P5EAZ8_9HYPO|nr:HET-domain containing protein [Fusarium agapanthi]
MNEIQQQILQLPGSIQPHYCRLCRNFIIIDDVKDKEDKGGAKGKSLHIRRTYTLKQACEFANSGCVMFSLQLMELHRAQNACFLSMSGLLREICGAACGKRLQQFYPLVPSSVLEELDDWSFEIKLSLEDASQLASYWMKKDSSQDLDHRPMILFTDEESCLRNRIANRPLQPKAELMKAKRWLQECLDHHKECGETAEPEMPSRLIYIGNSDCKTLRLEDTKTAQIVSYAALSYCWGDTGHNRFKTEKETLAIRKQGFDYIQLPSTLRDAVKVARTLDLEYLWVDALCIVQDWEEDKSKEISKIDQGFLHERDLESCYLSTWAIPWHKVDNEGNRFEEFAFCAEGEIRRVRKEPIDSRAWTLQENKLANRVSRFGSSQMIWRCSRGYFVDGGSKDEESLDKDSTVVEVKGSYEWTDMVEEFTTRFIGEAKDRLPAFAAVAADYAQRHNIGPDEYKAGLWTPWIEFGLLWYIKDLDDEATYPDILSTEEKSPTWSWHLARSGISWPESIPYQGDADDFNLVVKYSQVELSDYKVEYGRVRGGSLEVSGALLKIHLLGTRPVYFKPNGELSSAPIIIRWDSKIIPSETEFFCLEVRHVHKFIAEGIVLKQSSGLFYRVGYFKPYYQKSTPTESIWRDRKTIFIK